MSDMMITDDENVVRASRRFTMKLLDPKMGDKSVSWDTNNPDEIEDAQASFDYYLSRGYKAYQVDAKGQRTLTEVKKFDPDLGSLMMVPAKQLVGG